MKINRLLPIAAAALLAVTVAGCGRRGPLEPPPDTAQGRTLAKQRASQDTRRGIAPANAPTTAEAQKQDEAVQAIHAESEVREDDALAARDREVNALGEPQAAFPTGTDLVRAPDDEAKSKQDTTLSPRGSARKPPGIIRPKTPFILDPLLN